MPLLLVPIHLGRHRDLLPALAARLPGAVGLDVSIAEPWFDAEECFDPARGQYSSTQILGRLLAPGDAGRRPGPGPVAAPAGATPSAWGAGGVGDERPAPDPGPRGDGHILGVAGVDLFIPVLTYVFGEAQLDGRAAVVSTWRLDPEAYGLPADRGALLDRLEKEALHEIGHTFGLLHCAEADCVMRRSTYVEEIDLKPARFCPECARAVPGRREAWARAARA